MTTPGEIKGFARLDKMRREFLEHNPINPNWEEDGWSTPRFKGTGKRAEQRLGQYLDYSIPPSSLRNYTLNVFESPRKMPSPGFMFDGQYSYMIDIGDPDNLYKWGVIGAATHEWQWEESFLEMQFSYHTGWHINGYCCLYWECDINFITLTPFTIRQIDFQGANLNKLDWRNKKLTNARFQDARLWGASFREASMHRVNLSSSSLWYSGFQESKLRSLLFDGASINEVDFTNSDVMYTSFRGGYLSGCKFLGADFLYCDFRGSWIVSVSSGEIGTILSTDVNSTTRKQYISSGSTQFHRCYWDNSYVKYFDFSRCDLREEKNLNLAFIEDCRWNGSVLKKQQFQDKLITETATLWFIHEHQHMQSHLSSPVPRCVNEYLHYKHIAYANNNEGIEAVKYTSSVTFPWKIYWPYWRARLAFAYQHPEPCDLATRLLNISRDTYLRLKKCYLDQGNMDDASLMAYREKESERQLLELECMKLFWPMWEEWNEPAPVFRLILLLLWLFIQLICSPVTAAIKRQQLKSKSSWWNWLTPSASVMRMYLSQPSFPKDVASTYIKDHVSPPTYRQILEIIRRNARQPLLDCWNSGPRNWQTFKAFWKKYKELLGYYFYRKTVGYGEYPFRAAWTALWSILAFTVWFWIIGTPVLVDPVRPEIEYSIRYWPANNWDIFYFWESLKQASILSLESFSSLGFFWLSQQKYSTENFWAAIECLWGLFLVALFLWAVGRRLAAR